MMMASNFVTSNSYRDLIHCVNTSHMRYLQEDKYSGELKYRKALEDHVREFINYESHANKFNFPRTTEVLRKNVKSEYFNALKAAQAWSSLSIYAKNLHNQPWRPEFHEIKLYSGFYKHQIESHLSGAESILELMGYRRIGNRLVIEEPIDAEILREVSLDTLKAMCECQILFSIYEKLAKRVCNCTYADILKYRELYPGSAEETIRSILYRTPTTFCVDCYTDSSLCGYPPNDRADTRGYSQTYIPTMNGYVTNFPDEIPHQFSNGLGEYARTAKLIDFDDPHEHDDRLNRRDRESNIVPSKSSEQHSRSSDHFLSDGSNVLLNDKSFRRLETRKGDDGSWDQVHKLSNKETAKNKPMPISSNQPRPHLRSNGVSEALSNISLRSDSEKNDKSSESVTDGRKQSMKKLNFLELNKTGAVKKSDRSQTWACEVCTFINAKSRDVCEMCGKSKIVPEEVPLESGGKHCSICTLVNKKEATKCEACEENLEYSPTYV